MDTLHQLKQKLICLNLCFQALSPTHGQFSVQTPHPHVLRSDSNLPQIFRPNNNNTAIVNWPTVNSRHGSVALPRPPISLRPRPLSTLARRPSTEKLPQAVTLAAQGLLVCGFAGLWVCQFVGLLVCWFAGLLVCQFVGLLVCQSVNLLVC